MGQCVIYPCTFHGYGCENHFENNGCGLVEIYEDF